VARTLVFREQLTAGLTAGIVGGILIALFQIATTIAGGATTGRALQMFPWIASVLFGPGILTNPAAPQIGVVLHLCVAIGWALGYVYLIRSQPQLLRRPLISGFSYGLVVYCFMEIVLITAGQYHRPSPPALAAGLIAHTVFYGIPVALVVSRLLGRGLRATQPTL
jgi:hypothetical protein